MGHGDGSTSVAETREWLRRGGNGSDSLARDTRGAILTNLGYVFTTSPKQADPAPGPRPAPELARCDQIYPERTSVRAPGTPPAPPGTALAVLAVLDRDGQQRSATQTRDQALADADHLAILHAIWTAETTPAREQQYRDLLMGILPPGDRREPSHQVKCRKSLMLATFARLLSEAGCELVAQPQVTFAMPSSQLE